MQDMTTRSGHYTALLETLGARGATKLHPMSASSCWPSPTRCYLATPTASRGSPGRWS